MLYKCCRILRIRLLQAFLLMVLKSFDSWTLQGLPCYTCSWQCAFVHKYRINFSSTQHSEEGKGNSKSINQSIFNCSMFDFPFWMSFLFSRWKCHTLHWSPCTLSPSHAPGCSHQHCSLTHEGLRSGIWSVVLRNYFGRTDWSCCKIHHDYS